jgi:DNA-binding response OmpR family regulator
MIVRSSQNSSAPAREKTVLVVGDEPHTRIFIRSGLERHGYSVREAELQAGENGTSVASIAQQAQPDLIVLDLGPSGESGAEVLRTLSSSLYAPIIVLSSEHNGEPTAHLLKIGAADHLVKPVGIAELAARCGTALRRDRSD